MYKNINKAVVFGAGTMGASIAALLASVGVETVMLDIVPPKGLNDDEIAKGYTTDTYEYRNRFTLAGLDRIKKPKNMLLYSKGAIKNIRIGPSLPAFISPTVLSVLVEKFGLTPITTAEEDLKHILG